MERKINKLLYEIEGVLAAYADHIESVGKKDVLHDEVHALLFGFSCGLFYAGHPKNDVNKAVKTMFKRLKKIKMCDKKCFVVMTRKGSSKTKK